MHHQIARKKRHSPEQQFSCEQRSKTSNFITRSHALHLPAPTHYQSAASPRCSTSLPRSLAAAREFHNAHVTAFIRYSSPNLHVPAKVAFASFARRVCVRSLLLRVYVKIQQSQQLFGSARLLRARLCGFRSSGKFFPALLSQSQIIRWRFPLNLFLERFSKQASRTLFELLFVLQNTSRSSTSIRYSTLHSEGLRTAVPDYFKVVANAWWTT